MARQIDNHPMTDLADLVDAIGELESAVLDMHCGFRMGKITAVDIAMRGIGFKPSETRLEILDRNAEQLFDMPHGVGRGKQNDAILGFDACVAVRAQHRLVPVDRADAKAGRQVEIAEGLADQRRGLECLGSITSAFPFWTA